MLRVLWNNRSNMIAQQEKMDNISNNLANVNTEGYKRVEVSFKDLMTESLDRKGYPITDNDQRQIIPYTGTGVRASTWIRDNSQGTLTETSKLTDLAIDGEGYYKIVRNDGAEFYTRAGDFKTDSFGRLVTSNGDLLEVDFYGQHRYKNSIDEEDNDIVEFNKENFIVDFEGKLYLKDDPENAVGKINIYTATGSDSFNSVGENLYTPKDGVQVFLKQDTNIMQGYSEMSNVDMVREMTEMIVTQRAFQLGSSGIRTADEMWGIVNNMRGR